MYINAIIALLTMYTALSYVYRLVEFTMYTNTGSIFNYPSCLDVQVIQRIVQNGLSCTLHIKFHTIFPAPNIVHVCYASAYELSSIYL